MKDGEDTPKAPAPSDAPPADAGGNVVQLVAEAKKPADEAARQKEADRARRRRLMEKLKGAKDAEQLKKLMRQLGAGDEGEAAALAESDAPAPQLEPGQRPGWPPPSVVAQLEPVLAEALATSGRVGLDFIDGQEPAQAALRAVCQQLEGEAGKRLAEAWAPVLALYLPALMASPWGGAAVGTVMAGAMIAGAAKKAAAEAGRAQEGKAAA